MAENNEQINQLLQRLELLLQRQDGFSREINDLREEIKAVKTSFNVAPFEEKKEAKPNIPAQPIETKVEKINIEPTKASTPNIPTPPKRKSDLEKFIGENLISKIGIAIMVFGVAIGAKYSIEHQLISPLTRIILGYLVGLGLLVFGIKLKAKYENYSAVLVSGAMAILYFITFAAYSFYDLIPQLFAFALMVVFTAFTVVAAIKYNQQIIAHIGLVGAYAVPFLLSEGSGKVAILFSYMAIINIGILIIAFKKYWKPLYHSSFILTWVIVYFWYLTKYEVAEHFTLALIFIAVFFAIFYSIFLAYKLITKEKFNTGDIVLLLANSFIFYGLGYAILSEQQTGEQLLGLFTLGNAIIHFTVSAVIYKQKLADRNLFFLIAGLVLVFITIAVPVQLDGNWVTLIWVFEAALLFWIGTTKNIPIYEKLSYPLMFLAFISLIQDWQNFYNNFTPQPAQVSITPFININFLSSLLFIAAFIFINYLNKNRKATTALFTQKNVNNLVSFSLPAILIFVLYYAFRIEIETYWNQLYMNSALEIKKVGQDYADSYWNYDYKNLQTIWVINYSLLFFSILSFVNIKKIKDKNLGIINIIINSVLLLIFLAVGLYVLADLRDSYLNKTLSAYYKAGSFNIGIRYISFALAALMLVAIYKYLKQDFLKLVSKNIKVAFDLLLHTSILWVASSELILWLDIIHFSQSFKIGLSILWGLYALFLIVLGIWKKKKPLRIFAIILFAVTLVKLFSYDISHLDTIAKTIVFVSLGILLLIISFLYNKYKHLIAAENEN